MNRKIEIPFLKDHHNHFSFYMALQDSSSLHETKSREEALNLLRELEPDRLSLVTGYNSGIYTLDKDDINDLGPVVVCNLSLHGFIMNRAAEKVLRDDYEDIVENYMDEEWREKNLNRFFTALSAMGNLSRDKVESFYNYLYNQGIYECNDMLLTGENVIDIVGDTDFCDKINFWADINVLRELSSSAIQKLAGVKLFTDGALGVKTAALNRPYLSGEKGLLLHTDEELQIYMKEGFSYKKKIAVHAIGDRAIEQVVRVSKDIRSQGFLNEEIRIEHCQLINKETAKKAKDLGIVLSMQPNFSYDSQFYCDRLPEAYIKANNPFRMLIDDCGFRPGVDLVFGSDGMPHGMNTALQSSLFPPLESQRLSIGEFIAGYCSKKTDAPICEIEIDEEKNMVCSCIK